MKHRDLIACHECDVLFRKPPRLRGLVAHCSSCGANIKGVRHAGLTLERVCAVTVASLVTYLIALAFPVLALETNGITSHATLFEAVQALWQDHMHIVAAMVFCTTILFPLLELVALLYLLLPLRAGRVPRAFDAVLRLVQFVRPWGMTEVFMLGVLITIMKMVSLARVIPETSLFAFGALTLMFCVIAACDPRMLWELRDEVMNRGGAEPTVHPATANVSVIHTGFVACHCCGLVHSRSAHASDARCARCRSPLHELRPESITRTFGLLLAAALLYIPANLLPIMHTSSLGRTEDDTILGGIAYFWRSGDWPLAVIVFVASVMVPMLKLAILTLQTVTAHRGSDWRPLERAKLYRMVERIGRWSMLDIFVVSLTVALVRFGSLAQITAGPGALAFGSVVVLTMLASNAFDPRLIWKNVRCRPARAPA
ncbi:paraquat-inducible protein A [Pandoraea eparura]|uniref:Paraquat-inducible protein A n=1 Tax=Pandoraea eparura TaxID=2508291 RepID=A0A5E4SL95_9BURK|nr:paraquat-inducible protein A [Pandoraea eparura]VVD75622.1 paraquat-inducible protein A [Pandoraea eparura]